MAVKVNNKGKWLGRVDLKTGLIEINKKRHKGNRREMLDTIVHEKLHLRHKNMKEKNIKRLTTKKIENMSYDEKQKHLAKVRMGKINKRVGDIKRMIKYKVEPKETQEPQKLTLRDVAIRGLV